VTKARLMNLVVLATMLAAFLAKHGQGIPRVKW
jgi:heme O synthase-like polyprenyltransferase